MRQWHFWPAQKTDGQTWNKDLNKINEFDSFLKSAKLREPPLGTCCPTDKKSKKCECFFYVRPSYFCSLFKVRHVIGALNMTSIEYKGEKIDTRGNRFLDISIIRRLPLPLDRIRKLHILVFPFYGNFPRIFVIFQCYKTFVKS